MIVASWFLLETPFHDMKHKEALYFTIPSHLMDKVLIYSVAMSQMNLDKFEWIYSEYTYWDDF